MLLRSMLLRSLLIAIGCILAKSFARLITKSSAAAFIPHQRIASAIVYQTRSSSSAAAVMKKQSITSPSRSLRHSAKELEIEECHANVYFQHDESFHQFSDAEVLILRENLLQFYWNYRRKLPWRGDAPPYNSNLGAEATTRHVKNKQTLKRKHKKEASGAARQKTLDSFFAKPQKERGTRGGAEGATAAAAAAAAATATRTGDAVRVKAEGAAARFEVSSYATWVSEIMLQQTQVDTVIDYFLRWMEKFPTLGALAAASEEEVNAAWAGLGYYSRARRLREGAAHVRDRLGGQIPSTTEELLKIPGIGPYTAGAISSISFNQTAPLVDGNVIRVFSRLRAINNTANNSSMTKLCWDLAGKVLDPQHPGDFNQALMELGATICTPKNADCQSCPVKSICKAKALADGNELEVSTLQKVRKREETAISKSACKVCMHCIDENGSPGAIPCDVHDFPKKKEKKEKPVEYYCVSVITVDGGGCSRYLMLKRPAQGLLAGQWEFPSLLLDSCANSGLGPHRASIAKFFEEKFGPGLLDSDSFKTVPIGDIQHVFSHKKHVMMAQQVLIASTDLISPCGDQEMEWMDPERMKTVGITTNMKKVYEAVLKTSKKIKMK